MQLVRDHTSISTPTIRRVLPNRRADPFQSPDRLWIVMDYVPGPTLFAAWPSLTEEHKARIINDLARYIRELQQVPLPFPDVPGPLHPAGTPIQCIGHFFSEMGAGPFSTYHEMVAWFDRQRFCCRVRFHRQGWLMPCPKFDASLPLVLCHCDIHPRNVVLDEEGTPWIIDWGAAGAYPPWFEYASIAVSSEADYSLKEIPAWKDLTTSAATIAGDYAPYYDGYLSILFTYTEGLNYDILAKDTDFPDNYFEALGMHVE